MKEYEQQPDLVVVKGSSHDCSRFRTSDERASCSILGDRGHFHAQKAAE